jgi:DNA-binding FadR family transcriptional regulator
VVVANGVCQLNDIGLSVDRLEPTPPYYQLYQELRRRIERGSLSAGDRLPAVSELSRLSGVSQATVVRTLNELKRHGLVTAQWGTGHFVAEALSPATEVIYHAPMVPAGSLDEGYNEELLHALHEAFGEPARRFALNCTGGSVMRAEEILGILAARRADSLIVRRADPAMAHEIAIVAERIPTVSLFRPISDSCADAVLSDPAAALAPLLTRRIASGRRHFLFACRSALVQNTRSAATYYGEMQREYCAILQKAGIEPLVLLFEDAGHKKAGGRPFVHAGVAAALKALPEDATVILAAPSHVRMMLLERRLDVITYTEYRPMLESLRGRFTVLYMDLGRVAREIVRLLRERRAGDRRAAGRSARLVPDVIKKEQVQ